MKTSLIPVCPSGLRFQPLGTFPIHLSCTGTEFQHYLGYNTFATCSISFPWCLPGLYSGFSSLRQGPCCQDLASWKGGTTEGLSQGAECGNEQFPEQPNNLEVPGWFFIQVWHSPTRYHQQAAPISLLQCWKGGNPAVGMGWAAASGAAGWDLGLEGPHSQPTPSSASWELTCLEKFLSRKHPWQRDSVVVFR